MNNQSIKEAFQKNILFLRQQLTQNNINSTNEIKTSKEELQMKNLKLEKELIEKRNKIGQMEFENEILSEKLLERLSDIYLNRDRWK
jgi:predicted nuclease with TOPRIM domain